MHPTSPNFGSPYHQTYPELMMPRCITEQGEFLVFLFPLLTYRKKKVMLDSSSRKAGGVGELMKAVGGGGKKYKHFQEGRDVTHKSKRKKRENPRLRRK